jgi:hypothetical protein
MCVNKLTADVSPCVWPLARPHEALEPKLVWKVILKKPSARLRVLAEEKDVFCSSHCPTTLVLLRVLMGLTVGGAEFSLGFHRNSGKPAA